nr:integrase, catalytic region, zinc finger, CCHC-type, peptidase aspartic, catalytic [Tanacetum cinerariifolium]
MMASSPICLVSKSSKTKSWLWHRRLSHLNFGAINHLARQGLVRGLPKLKLEKDHLCSACAMGKIKKKSRKPKSEDTSQEKLYLLHVDLCGPMRVESINGKKYILVIVDDYSRFTLVKCLRLKNEAPDFIIKFLKMIPFRLKVGISHETSVTRSPRQNGVVKRHNRTLIEAARTMLIYAQAPLFRWAEAVAIACYTQNRSIVRLRHGKTPYELLHGKLPDLSFLYGFGALYYPTNDSESLGKQQPKADIAPEVIALITKVVALKPTVSTGSPFSTTVDQDAPSPKAIRIFLAFAAHKNMVVYQMDVMTAFLNENLWEEVFISQPDGFLDPDNPNHVYKLKKALYGLKQAPCTWYDMLSSFLISQDFSKGSVDPTLFIRRNNNDLILSCDPVDTPMVEKSKLDEDKEGKAVDPSHYRGIISTLLYLTASRPVLKFAICVCARYQAQPNEKHLHAVKRIFRYLRGTVNRGLWYPKDSSIALTAFADTDHAGCQDTRHSTSGSSQFLGDRLISWSSKRSKHINIRYYFIKEHVKNGVIELYFVNMEYKLADIFTKALGRERIEFLIHQLGMRSFTPEALKQLTNEVDE